MRRLLCALSIAVPLLAADNSLTGAEAQEGWILLFDGQTNFGWSQESGKWKIANGIVSCDGSETGLYRTKTVFSDYVLKLDFRAAADADGGVFLRIAGEGTPQETGYEVRLGESDARWPGGSVVKVFRGDGKLPTNQWHTLEAEVINDKIAVKIDGRKIGDGADGKSKAGYIALAANRGGAVDFRNVRLKPLGTRLLFNGNDLSGWKSVGETPAEPKAGGGLIKGVGKVFKGGKPKPKEAVWSVADGAIHGSKGPGQLESEAAYDDFVLQFEARVNAKNKGHHPKTAVLLRGDAGKLETGYGVEVANDATGAITGLKPPRKNAGKDNEYVTETIAARGRHFEIWVNGNRVNEYDDTRPQGMSPKKEARTTAGPIALLAPDAESNLDFRSIKIAALPKTIGGRAGTVAAVAPAPVPATPSAPASASPGTPGSVAQIPAAAPQVIVQGNPNQAKEDAKQAKVAQLEKEALHSSDPVEQARIYESILEVDPNNLVASQGYSQAKQKIDQTQAQQQKTVEEQARQNQEQAQKSATFDGAMKAGEAAFLAGNLMSAQSHLATAQRIAPDNPQLQNLQNRLNSALQARQRVTWLVTGAGALILLGGLGALFMSLGKKSPYLEVIDGLEKGKRFPLEQEVIRIGAIAEDGDAKNDIVLRDIDRMISRFHCEIHRQQKKFFLVDVNSANGTYLDKRSIAPGKPVRLKKGSVVGLGGSCTLRVGFEKKKKE